MRLLTRIVFTLALSLAAATSLNAALFFHDKDEWFLKMARQQKFDLDTSAPAIVLYEQRSYDLQSSMRLNGMMIQQVHRVIKILNRKGVSYGDISILLRHAPGSGTSIHNLKGTTYTADNGQLAIHRLAADNIAKDETKYLMQAKFSMPAVQPGAVLDIYYTIESPVSLLFASCDFQHDIPTLYSELEVWMPAALNFLEVAQGGNKMFQEFDDTRKSISEASCPETYQHTDDNATPDVMHKRWVRRNLPAIVSEPFSLAALNFQEQLQLRINSLQGKGAITFGVMDSWDKVNESLLASFSFYRPIELRHNTLYNKATELIAGKTASEEKARAIFRYVRNTMHAQGYTDIYISKDMEELFSNRSGSPSEINLILTTMLRYAGLNAVPLLIATQDNRGAISSFPELTQFNKTICMLDIGGRKIYLDASGPNNAFGVMPPDNYNGYARFVGHENGGSIILEPGTLKERHVVMVNTERSDLNDYEVRVVCQYGAIQAGRLRGLWRPDTTMVRKYILSSLGKMGIGATLQSYHIDGLQDPDTALSLTYILRLDVPTDGKPIYINPTFVSYFSENPFKATQRKLPIVMPGALDAYYILKLQLPTGYKMDDSPKPEIVTLDDANTYKYLYDYDAAANCLKLSTRVHMETTSYSPEEYPLVRQFFDKILESQQKTYVFKKS